MNPRSAAIFKNSALNLGMALSPRGAAL